MVCPVCGAVATRYGPCPGCGRAPSAQGAVVAESAVAASLRSQDEVTTRLADGHVGQWGPLRVPFAPGQRVADRYYVIKLLGVGGMGAVYQAWDDKAGTTVALKVILPELAADPAASRDLEERFRRELRLARRITHENVVRIHDIGEYEGIKFITMPLVQGVNLARLLAEQHALPVRRALGIARQIAEGLAAAHKAEIVHRDLKPANVMIGEQDKALLMDFGIARAREGSTGATRGGAIVGTIEYMAPEQGSRGPVDERADVYAFGLILYEMLLGPRRINHENALADLVSRMTHAPPSMRSIDPAIPVAIDSLVARCLAPNPAERLADGQALVAALSNIDENGHAIGRRVTVTRRRLGLELGAAAMAAASLVAGLAWWAISKISSGEPQTREPTSVLIADFVNRTGDAVFDGAIEHALSVSVEGASFVAAYPRRDALRLAAQIKPGGSLDEQVARLVARREGVDVVLAGGIATAPVGFELSVRALDGATGSEITSTTMHPRAKHAVLGSVARAAARIRRVLGDTTPESEQLAAAETFTASSVEAAHAYAAAQDLFWAGRQQEATAAYEKAIALDPTLGRAYAGLAATYNNAGNQQQAAKYYELTMKHVDRMSDREKHRTLGAYYLFVRNTEKALDESKELVRKYPADVGGLNNLALAQFYKREMGTALGLSRQALQVYPENLLMRNNLALYAMYAGDFAMARQEAQEVLRRNASYAKAWLARAIVTAVEGDLPGAAVFYDRLASVHASMAALGRGDLAMFQGRLEAAMDVLRNGAAADRAAGNVEAAARKLTALAEASAGLGRGDDALEALKQAVSLSRSDAVLTEAARVHVALGNHREAGALAERLADSLEADPRAYAKIIEGESLMARNAPRDALRAFLDARRIADVWLARVLAGRAYLELNAFTEAYAEFDLARKRQGEATALFLDDVPTTRLIPPLHYWRGRAQEALGSPAAVDSYKRFLSFRGGRTSDPLVDDAQRRLGGR